MALPPDLAMPDGLRWMADVARMQPWLAALSVLVARAVDRWELDPEAPYAASHISWVAPVRRADGTRAVLKIQFPHAECEQEADALRQWDGDGAVRLLAHDAEDHALLVERCEPGTHLSALVPGGKTDAGSRADGLDSALDVLGDLLRRLLVPAADPFPSLADEAAGWADRLPDRWERAGRPFDERLVDAARSMLDNLACSQPDDKVLIHQDLHADNVCRAERRAWLAIDPKPLVGDLAFAAAPIVRANELGHSRADVLRRLDTITDALGLDRTRATGWAFGQTLAWSIDDNGGIHHRHVETATWLLDRWEDEAT